jgi:3'-phosphoadenosine 5'-phosphosulfate sulfotransferase (PAPS reductase)/FAD synthetase
LSVTGERKAEGGQRAVVHKTCFEEGNHGIDKFMPLFWWTDETKADFKKSEEIRYSDCYEIWGMKRTGCVGCPFGKDTAEELRLMHEYEPNLYNACMKVFGQAYELTDRFNCRRKKCLPDFIQLRLF